MRSWHIYKTHKGPLGQRVFQYQVGPFLMYRESIVLLSYVDGCLMFSSSKDKIYNVYAFIQADLKCEDDG